MNQKQRLAIVLLVIAIVLFVTSILVEVSIAKAEKAREEAKINSGEVSGTIQLEILPQKGREVDEGG